jgi:hypothetical protein
MLSDQQRSFLMGKKKKGCYVFINNGGTGKKGYTRMVLTYGEIIRGNCAETDPSRLIPTNLPNQCKKWVKKCYEEMTGKNLSFIQTDNNKGEIVMTFLTSDLLPSDRHRFVKRLNKKKGS